MARSKSDISNTAIRMFLQDVGKFYDEARGYTPFKSSGPNKTQLLNFFDNKCCYCNIDISVNSISLDHLIPMNKADLGLHAWGNVVPSCGNCNAVKQKKDWIAYLFSLAQEEEFNRRKAKIEQFTRDYNYNPNLNLQDIAENLYQDVGEVALTLIKLRYTQAEKIIRGIIGEE
ncbi:HNH endonuclease [Paenibacillus sp. WC2504]|uniref:HNH endonuclease n=1 Tax=Paenibacillus sp. WC2504 TaxID=3461403 RepID=UPI00404595F3